MASLDVEEAGASLDRRCGFSRAELFSEPLAGTVKAHDCHLFLCSGSAASWASKTEESEPHAGLDAALRAAKEACKKTVGSVKTTLFEAAGDDADGDVLLFPQRLRWRPSSLPVDWPSFVATVLLQPGGATAATPGCSSLTAPYAFVCAHGRRDKRCGVCGPPLLAALREAPGSALAVRGCSHVGGHAYAGNVLLFSRRAGVPRGDWFGYVTPADVPELLAVAQGGPIPGRLWRGALGMTPEMAKEEAKDLQPGCAGCANA